MLGGDLGGPAVAVGAQRLPLGVEGRDDAGGHVAGFGGMWGVVVVGGGSHSCFGACFGGRFGVGLRLWGGSLRVIGSCGRSRSCCFEGVCLLAFVIEGVIEGVSLGVFWY